MELLISQFASLSDQALGDTNFDPSRIEDLTKLFDPEADKAWAAMELEHEPEFQQVEEYLDSAMDSAMEEFRQFKKEMVGASREELKSMVQISNRSRKMGRTLEKAATVASKKYIEAAFNSAGVSMRSAKKSISSNPKKVHPS